MRVSSIVAALVALVIALPSNATEPLQWSGFALVRGESRTWNEPFGDSRFTSQLQLGLDWWTPSMDYGAHVHVIARNAVAGDVRGTVGTPEAYIEANFHPGNDRLRLRGGAFFLPTSRENVDALWETPYSLTSSALNTWMGEEFRPIGLDAVYTWRQSLGVGATVYRGNEAFGAIPVSRGWIIGDHWALLGERLRLDADYDTAISTEYDHRLGWAGRVRWSRNNGTLQLTHIDNRADGEEHGRILNWNTRFDIAGFDYTINDWTVAGESGWGPTDIFHHLYVSDLRASYLLVSRRLPNNLRATLRGESLHVDAFHDHAYTAALLWTPPGHVRTGVEVVSIRGKRRVALDVRYDFSGR